MTPLQSSDLEGPGITFALAGVGIGIVLGLATVRLLQHMLWGVRPVDADTFAFTGMGLLAVAAVTCAMASWTRAAVHETRR
jgi:hypothetical protein